MKPPVQPSYFRYFFSLLKVFIFWMLIFWMNRLAFLLFFREQFAGTSLKDLGAVFFHGFCLDVSMAGYLMIVPFLVLIVQQFIRFSFYKAFLFAYCAVVMAADAFISIFDLGIYHDWHTHLNYRAINYLHYANQAAAFSDAHEDHLLAVYMIAQFLIGLALSILLFRKATFRFPSIGKRIIPALLFHASLIPLLFLGIRGGLQLIPINESSAYFSAKQVLNDAAVNVLWNAGKKFFDNKDSVYKNPYVFFPASRAEALTHALYTPAKDSVTEVLTTDRPNIVLFVLESFTADVFEALGGEQGVTPNLDTVIHHGLLFTHIYSQGYRTDQGLACVLSGFPATPDFSIMMQPEKYPKLSFLPKAMAAAGYSSSFYYGGELDFANMKAYLLQGGISNLHDKSSYPKTEMNAKWGAHDEFVFKKQAGEMQQQAQPFFSVILSLSSHEPFEVPMKPQFPGDEVADKFKTCCYYTDHSIGNYLKEVSQLPWYKNTLFIFVADHGHILPRNRKPWEAARFHIPIIFYGEVLKPEYRGMRISNTGMQCDLPATLLAQLHLPDDEFRWSNNLLNPWRNNFAYYSYDSGIGLVKEDTVLRFDLSSLPPVVSGKQVTPFATQQGEAFLQTLFGAYVQY